MKAKDSFKSTQEFSTRAAITNFFVFGIEIPIIYTIRDIQQEIYSLILAYPIYFIPRGLG